MGYFYVRKWNVCTSRYFDVIATFIGVVSDLDSRFCGIDIRIFDCVASLISWREFLYISSCCLSECCARSSTSTHSLLFIVGDERRVATNVLARVSHVAGVAGQLLVVKRGTHRNDLVHCRSDAARVEHPRYDTTFSLSCNVHYYNWPSAGPDT